MKKLLCISVITIILILFTACDNPVTEYEFPLSQTDVEKVLNDKKLSWNIESSQYPQSSQAAYILKNDDGVTCIIDSKGTKDERFLSANFSFPKDYTIEQLHYFQSEEISKLFDFSATLYGNGNEAKPVFNEFFTYIRNIDSTEELNVLWNKRVTGDHFLFRMSPHNDASSNYTTNSLIIMNNIAYERYIAGAATALTNSVQNIRTSTVADILEMEKTLNETIVNEEQFFVIRGNINEISEMKNIPESLAMAYDDSLPSYKENYLSGKLTDDTGNMNVFLRLTSFTDEELKQERDHYVMRLYYEQEIYYVVLFSVLIT